MFSPTKLVVITANIMKSFSLNFNILISFHLLLLAFFTFYSTIISAQFLPPLPDIVCSQINCGEGTCKPSNESLLGFDCDCNPGWKELKIGSLPFPSCVVPNCTINFQCDGPILTPPPPTPGPVPPACAFVWCGDGTCVSNGTAGYVCQCPQGSWNLMDLPGLACFKPCYFGGDCKSKDYTSHDNSSDTHSSQGNRITITAIMSIWILLTWII